MIKNPSANAGDTVLSLGQEDSLEEEMATQSCILPWEIPWAVEPGRLQSIVLQKVGHDWSSLAYTHAHGCKICVDVNFWMAVLYYYWTSLVAQMVKASAYNGRSPGEGNGNQLQYSCLEYFMDRGAWQASPWGSKKVSRNLGTKHKNNNANGRTVT